MKRITLLLVAVATACMAAFAQGKTLVAYFSATGNTQRVAKMVASATGATIYEIKPVQEYTNADLNWHNDKSRSSVEMADAAARPAITADLQDIAEYDTIYLGYPIWWNLAPRVINTFIEKYNFDGKTVIPFATSGSSSIDNSANELQKSYPAIKWGKGKLLNRATIDDIKTWTKQQ